MRREPWFAVGLLLAAIAEVQWAATFYGDENDWTVFLLTGCDPRATDRLGPTGRCRLVK